MRRDSAPIDLQSYPVLMQNFSYSPLTSGAPDVAGARATLYSRAKHSLEGALPLIDGLRPLDPDSGEDWRAIKAMVKELLSGFADEFGTTGALRVSRVDRSFVMLVGALGYLRANAVDDEQNLTNFLTLSDYVTSIAQAWLANLRFF